MPKAERSVQCDVLVVGAGAAGLTAAIEARSRSAAVAVACKGKAGRSGNTVVAASQFSAVIPYEGSEDSPERHFLDSLTGGRGINDETLLRLFVDQAGPRLLEAEQRGVKLLRSNGELVRRTPPGHSQPRGIPVDNGAFPMTIGGLSITLPLRATADRMGVKFLDESPVLKLARMDGEIRGALAVDLAGEELVAVQAGAVVVAAGGAGRIFVRTNNTRDICGDSYGLMLDAGAALRDMEFVQFYPSQLTTPFKAVAISSLFGDGAVLRNRHGERFMPAYDPVNEDRATRDVMSQAIFYEIQKGNGIEGEVYMDCTAVAEEVLQKKYFGLVRDLRKQGVDPARDWLKIAPTTHFMMGGAVVDERCRTTVPGLFAAGEAAGGVHGANRLGGNALSETLVLGSVAGEAAAKYALKEAAMPPAPVGWELPPDGGDGIELLDEVRRELRKAMWDGASIVRSGESLRSALATVRACAAEPGRCSADSAAEMARVEETRLMCLTAESVVLSAIARQESRGAHFREDFPSSSERWLGSNLVRLAGGELHLEFVPKQGTGVRGRG